MTKQAQIHPFSSGPRLSKSLAAEGMRTQSDDVKTRSALAWERQLEAASQFNKSLVALLSRIGAHLDIRELINELSPPHRRRPVTKLPRPYVPPGGVDQVFLTGARVTPPFDYAGTLPGGPPQFVDASNGEMNFTMESLGQDYHETACCSIGIHLTPPVDGRLTVFSDPSLHEHWSDYAYVAAAHSDAFIGFWIGEYDANGVFQRALVDQRSKLWDDNSHLSDSGDHEEDVPGYPLFAFCSVSAWHQYVISVSIGGSASADRTIGGAGAISALYAVIPSITWELT